MKRLENNKLIENYKDLLYRFHIDPKDDLLLKGKMIALKIRNIFIGASLISMGLKLLPKIIESFPNSDVYNDSTSLATWLSLGVLGLSILTNKLADKKIQNALNR